MRRFFLTLFAAAFFFVSAPIARAEGTFNLVVNGFPLSGEAKPFWHETHAMLPVRNTFEAMGYRVEYDAVQKSIDMISPILSAKHITLGIDRTVVIVNGTELSLQTPVIERGGQAFVSAEIFDHLGFWTQWEEAAQIFRVVWKLPENVVNRFHEGFLRATQRFILFRLIEVQPNW